MVSQIFVQTLQEACQHLPIPLSNDLFLGLEQHWQLVKQWNARTNLTAITDDNEAAWLHYRDSLEALPLLPKGPIIDIGSGAGFPGLVLAIVEPHRPVTLLEPRQKRASFLTVAAARLGLKYVKVVCDRVNHAPMPCFHAALSRATFSTLAELHQCLAWLLPGGSFIAFRSTPSGDKHTTLHAYTLKGEKRFLEMWRR